MAIVDLCGVPFPKKAPLFKNDEVLLKKIKRLEDLIEIRKDINDAEDALIMLKRSIELDDNLKLVELFGGTSFKLPDIILSYIIVLYSRVFTNSNARINLNNKVNEIFNQKKYLHEELIRLRHKFYAHQELEANSHQLFCLKNTPDTNSIKLNPDSQIFRIIMAKSIDFKIIDEPIKCLLTYLNKNIETTCLNIENSLSKEQIDFINITPKKHMLDKYWETTKSAFEDRKT